MEKAEPPTEAAARTEVGTKQGFMAGGIIGSHTLTHLYSRGFLVVIPQIYTDLGLVPIEAGLLDAVRWLSSGISSLFVGFFADMFQHRRGLLLGLSMALLGLGYLLIGLAPTYLLILVALGVAAVGGAIWHPPALGLLSQRFPKQRGLMMALHRSTGSIGDTLGPLLVGFLLVGLTWQGRVLLAGPGLTWRQVLQVGFPVALVLALFIWGFLWKVGGPRPVRQPIGDNLRMQWHSMKTAFQGSGMWVLLAVSALRGMADRAIFLFLPLYLAVELKMSSWEQGVYLALLTALGVVSGPLIGAISDRLGRKPVILLVMAASSIFPILIVLSGGGIGLTLAVAGFGIFLYSVNSLIQAAAMDVAAGRRLEGTFIGLLWGNNALFGTFSPIIAGALAGIWGMQAAFYYASAVMLTGAVLALWLPIANSRQAAGRH